MPGSWLAIVQGFAGMQIENGVLCFNPVIPDKWDSYTFNLNYRKRILKININKNTINIILIAGENLNINVYKTVYLLSKDKDLWVNSY